MEASWFTVRPFPRCETAPVPLPRSMQPTPNSTRSVFWPWGFVLMPAILLALLLPTISPGVTFSDGGEIATAIVTLGVIHPTGYPIFTVLAHLFQRLPLPFEAVVEISIFNCLLAAISATLIALSVRELSLHIERKMDARRPIARSRPPRPWIADVAGLLAGFAAGITPQLWQEVRIPEVYPFHMALTAAALFVWTRFETTREPKYIVWAAVPMGVGLAHHVTMVYMLPAAAVLVLLRKPSFFASWLVLPVRRLVQRLANRPPRPGKIDWPKPWMFPLACLIGALPLLSYGYLWWATQHTTGVPWSGIDSWDRLIHHVTGKQYRHFMEGFGSEKIPKRLEGLPNHLVDEYLVLGAALSGAGLLVTLRHALPYLLFLLLLAGANTAHALQYGVGNYLDYTLPALAGAAILLGVGLWRVALLLRGGVRGIPVWAIPGLCLPLIGLFGWQFHIVARGKGREILPPQHVDWAVGTFVGLAAGGLIVALALHIRRQGIRGLRTKALPGLLFGMVAAIYTFIGIARAFDLHDSRVVGAKHAEAVAREVPKGGIYMTMADGFVFSTYYYQHVLQQGIDAAMVKLRGPTSRWYKDLYIRSHHPRECDPLWGPHANDDEAYRRYCGTFADRMARPDQPSWVKISRPAHRWGAIRKAAERKEFRESGPPIRRGKDRRCKQASFRRKNYHECACWDYYERPYRYNAKCVHAAEEGGMVPRSKIEMYAHTMIEDHIHERPVFERNIFTATYGKHKNPRGWSGPARLRPSGEYALVNRGRTNQVVLARDIDDFDPCASDRLQRVPVPRLEPARERPLSRSQRTEYQPNDWPTLIKYTYLTRDRRDDSDHGTVTFEPGDSVFLHVDWYERHHYDRAKKSRRGKTLTHGIRLCAYDSDGNQVWSGTLVSGTHSTRVRRIPLAAAASAGTYTLQGCTVGEIRPGRDFEDMACQRPILEVDFEVAARD